MGYVPHTPEEKEAMLRAMGVSSLEHLLESVPRAVRMQSVPDLPAGLSEMEAVTLVSRLAEKNLPSDQVISFVGGGVYDHAIPSVVDHILRRSEFYTAYTPYQAEVSQGTLQTTYEYQSMICQLTGMDVANASMYDGASAAAEAVFLAHAARQGKEIVVAQTLNPHYLRVLSTYCHNLGLSIRCAPWNDGSTDLNRLRELLTADSACVLVQSPNFFGCVEPMRAIGELAHQAGALFIAVVDPISLGILEAPGAYGADVATGDGQALGNVLSCGGPSFGFFATRREHIRRMPGRITGRTVDAEGRPGYVLTLQTREQHIRREKATSNICTNEALNALAGAVYLAMLGQEGLREVAELCLQKSHYALQEVEKIDGFEPRFSAPFFKEFVVRTAIPPAQIISRLAGERVFAGLNLDRFGLGLDDCLAVAVTERRSKEDIDRFVRLLQSL